MIKANIVMKDGTKLKEVLLFKNEGLGDSEIKSKAYAELTLKGENPSLRFVYFGGKYVQGGIFPQQIASYEIIDNEEDIRKSLLNFIEGKNTIYDLNYPDVADFIMNNREDLLRMLK